MPGPLQGYRVFDLTLAMNGPWSTMVLGSLGADVLHVVQPDVDWRQLAGGPLPTTNGTSAAWVVWNMNKRSIFIDLKDPAGLSFARDVIRTCDVFVNNMRVGVTERLGVGYQDVVEINPGIVYCSATGYGRSGPMAKLPGMNTTNCAITGHPTIQGPRGGPGEFDRHQTQIDAFTANTMAQAVLMGLYARKRTGKGQFTEVTMLDAALTSQAPRYAEFFAGYHHAPRGSSSFLTAPDRAFLCQDKRWIGVSVTSEDEWNRFCTAVELPGLADDERFQTVLSRLERSAELDALLEPLFATLPSAAWEHAFAKAGVAYGVPERWEEFRYHRQCVENEFAVQVETTAWGTMWTGGPPWHFSRTPAVMTTACIPGLDTFDVQDEIKAMEQA